MSVIKFYENEKIFKIDTENVSYIMAIADNHYLGNVYYGAKISDYDVRYLMQLDEPPFTPSVNNREKAGFLDKFPMEYPAGGIGDFRESCIEIKNEKNQYGADFEYVGYRILEEKKPIKGMPAAFGDNAKTLEIELEDKSVGIRLVLSYSIFEDSDAIIKSVDIRNEGSEKVYLEKAMSTCLNINLKNPKMVTLDGAWGRERRISRREIGFGKTSVSSQRGISSHQENPFTAIVSEDCTQTHGQVYACNFVYSGNFVSLAERDAFSSIRYVMGINSERFEWVLESGENFQTPEVVMVYSDNGYDRMTHIFHDLYRNHLIRGQWKDKDRPVLINNWEATYFDFDTEKLLKIATEAKRNGIEMLVLDDGWFGKRNSDNCSLGDWKVNEEKLSGGLTNLAKKVNEIGLRFGLWIEPEMVSEDSDLYRAHPEWILCTAKRQPSQARAQYVLDITSPKVREYILDSIFEVIENANIEYIKWDMNRALTDIGSSYIDLERQGEILHRYTLAVYEMQEKLTSKYPYILLENCCSGGGRFDPGMLYYSPQIWCSDDTDAVERLAIQEGTQFVYPLSTIGAHVSDCPNHTTRRTASFEMRGVAAMGGTFGYELDVTAISEKDRSEISSQVERYKKNCTLIRTGDYYRLESYADNHSCDCYMVVSKAKDKAVVTYIQLDFAPSLKRTVIKMRGLIEDADYKIEDRVYRGDVLMKAGYVVKGIDGENNAKIIEINQII